MELPFLFHQRNQKPRLTAPLGSMPRSAALFSDLHASLMWEHVVQPCLAPKDVVHLSQVNRTLKEWGVRDALWKPLVAKVFDGAYIEELEKYNCLSAFTGKTFKDAFMAATTQRCAWCKTGYSQFVHAFTIKPICYACFEGKCKTDPTLQMVNKSTAKDVYLCSDKELKQLPCIVRGDPSRGFESVTILSKHQVEALAFARYPTGKEGLLADKQARKVKAEARLAKARTELAAKREAARKLGRPPPKQPKPSARLDATIPDDTSSFMVEWCKDAAILQVGFPSKVTGLEVGDGVIYCRLCSEAHPGKPWYHRPVFPSFDRLFTEHHIPEHPDWVAGLF